MASLERRGTAPTGAGVRTAANGVFAREAVLREAIALKVTPEDRAMLEALARYAFARPSFRAVTVVRLGDSQDTEATFEIAHDELVGPVVRRVPDDTELTPPAQTSAALGDGESSGMARGSPTAEGAVNRRVRVVRLRAANGGARAVNGVSARAAPPSPRRGAGDSPRATCLRRARARPRRRSSLATRARP